MQQCRIEQDKDNKCTLQKNSRGPRPSTWRMRSICSYAVWALAATRHISRRARQPTYPSRDGNSSARILARSARILARKKEARLVAFCGRLPHAAQQKAERAQRCGRVSIHRQAADGRFRGLSRPLQGPLYALSANGRDDARRAAQRCRPAWDVLGAAALPEVGLERTHARLWWRLPERGLVLTEGLNSSRLISPGKLQTQGGTVTCLGPCCGFWTRWSVCLIH